MGGLCSRYLLIKLNDSGLSLLDFICKCSQDGRGKMDVFHGRPLFGATGGIKNWSLMEEAEGKSGTHSPARTALVHPTIRYPPMPSTRRRGGLFCHSRPNMGFFRSEPALKIACRKDLGPRFLLSAVYFNFDSGVYAWLGELFTDANDVTFKTFSTIN